MRGLISALTTGKVEYCLRDVCQKKRENVGIFPKSGFGFHKNVHFLGGLWFVEVGTGDPPLKRKIPTLSRFVRFLLQNEHSGTQNKIN